jgi:hypothetical protein
MMYNSSNRRLDRRDLMEHWLVDMRQEYNRDWRTENILKWMLASVGVVEIIILLLVR